MLSDGRCYKANCIWLCLLVKLLDCEDRDREREREIEREREREQSSRVCCYPPAVVGALAEVLFRSFALLG
jgi:hypothetical protein